MQMHVCPHCGKSCFYYESEPYHKCLKCGHIHGIIVEPKEEAKRDLEAEAQVVETEMRLLRGWSFEQTVVSTDGWVVVGNFFPLGLKVMCFGLDKWEVVKKQIYTHIGMGYNDVQTDWSFKDALEARYRQLRGEAA